MKKTIRTLSMVMMALSMALCFLFAGLAFVRADVMAEVDQSALDTAAVYIGSLGDDFDADETGIKFTAKIKKTDYYALTGGTDAKGNIEVHLGVEVARANADGSHTTLPNAHFTVDTAGTLQTYNVDGVKLDDYFMYSFTIKYNLSNIFGENFDAEDPTIARNINFMYKDELCIRPFYQVISEVDGANVEGEKMYGEYGASRSMIHVAMAEYADENSSLSEQEKELFISKYVKETEDKGEIEVYADGRTNVELDSNIETYTIGTSGKVVARRNGAIDVSALEKYAIDDTFELFGYTADRTVITYHATFKGFTGISTTAVEDEFVLDEAGKLYLNNTQFEEATIESLFYSDGNFLDKATITEEVGEKIANGGLVARINGVYYKLKNVLYVTKAFENTRESRLDLVETFSSRNRSHISWYSTSIDKSREVGGYYVLLDNITLDVSNMPIGIENKVAAEDFDFSGRGNEIFSNGSESYVTTFNGTFDGRGYALNNIGGIESSSMFGNAADGATIKNVAFNSFVCYTRKWTALEDANGDLLDENGEVIYTKGYMDDGVTVVYSNLSGVRQLSSGKPKAQMDLKGVVPAHYYYVTGGMGTGAKFFYTVQSKEAEITFDNIYINDDTADNDAYGALLFYSPITEQEEGTHGDVAVYNQKYYFGQLNFNNVIIINAKGPVIGGGNGRTYVGITDTNYKSDAVAQYGVVPGVVNDSDNILDTYVITSSSISRNASTLTANSRGENIVKYTTIAKMQQANNDYTSFSPAYWTIVDGVPVWNSINVLATLKDGETAVTAIESNEADKEYKVEIAAYGKPGEVSKISVSGAENLVDYANGKITVKQLVSGEATLTVSYDGVVIATYNVNVETMPVITLTDKNDNAITEINSIDKNDVFTVTAIAGGKEVAVTLEKEDANNVINISGNVVTVNEKVVGSATLTVKIGGTVFATYNVSVDTIPLEEIGAEVLLSATDGRLYFNGIKGYEGIVITDAFYNDVSIFTDGKIDTTKIMATADIRAAAESMVGEGEDKKPGNQVTLKVVTSTGAKYLLTDVKLYTAVFENEHDSRMAMIEMFSYYAVRGHANGADSKEAVNDGYYVLAGNITFDHSNLPMSKEEALAKDNPENLSQVQWYKKAPYELFGNSSTANNTSHFAGVFDGRGYSLNNIGLATGPMFGAARDGAVVKNVAFNVFVKYTATVVDTTKVYFTESGSGTEAKIFGQIETAASSVTFENVYIKDPTTLDNGTYGSLVFYNAPKDANSANSQGKLTMKNVIIENAAGPAMSGATDLFDTISEDVVIKDTYLISTKNVGRGSATSAPNSRGETIVKYASYEAMAGANNSYLTFDNAYWVIGGNGVPEWKSLATLATLTDNTGAGLDTDKIGATYTVGVTEGGVEVESGYVIANTGDEVVTISGNVITTLANVEGTATITVTYNDKVIATFNIKVNTMPNVTLTGSNGAVTSIDSNISDEEFTVEAMQGGNDVSNQIEIEIDNNVVFVKADTNNVLVVGTNVSGTATVIVKIAGVEIARYEVSVNTRAVITLKDKEQNEITAINSVDKNDTFTVTAIAGGKEVAVTLEKEDVNNVIAINGNVVTVNEKVKGTATLIVKIAGEEFARYEVSVDTRVAEDNNEAVLLSKANGKLYFNGTSLAPAEITAVAYNGNSIFDGEKVDASAFTVNSEEPYALSIVTTANKYNLTNVMVYDAVFENTEESREDLLEVLNATSANYKENGYYVLAENITFVSGEKTAASDVPFIGTFDGRGYTLNDLTINNYNGLLGRGANVATLKNFALTNVIGSGQYVSILSDRANAGEVFNLENVYIYYNSTADNRYHSFHAYNTNDGTGTWNLENVIFELEFTTTSTISNSAKFLKSTKGVANNSYFIMNGYHFSDSAKFTSGNYKAYGGTAYENTEQIYAVMAADGNDYGSFSSQYWSIVNGVPVWNTTIDRVVLEDNAEKVNVTEISKPGSYTAKIVDKDKNVITEGLTITCDNENVTTNGNVITVNEGFYKTTITVTKGDLTATFAVSIDTRVADVIPAEKEILLSKSDNYIHVKGTALEEKKIISAVYGTTELVVDGALDLSKLDVAVNTQIALRVETEDGGLYEVENAKLYDAVFYNDPASRKAMVDLFSAGDRTTAGSSSAFDKETLTGYYVLAENLTFTAYAEDGVTVTPNEAFSNNGATYGSNTFKGTFDGRGYTLNNVIIYESQTSGGMFGIAGDGATLKNFAINGLAMVTGKASTGYTYAGASGNYSLLFWKPETVDSKITFENIYLNRDITSKTSFNGVFFNEGIATETVYTDYVYVTDEGSTTYKVEYTYYSFGQLTFNNVIVENKTTTSPIFTGGRAIAYQVEWDEANQKYVRVKNASNKDVGAYTYSFYGSQAPATSNVDAEGNVIIKGYSSDSVYTDAIVKDTDSISNTYFITTGKFGRDAVAPKANANGDEFKLYASEAKMIEANNDYTSFSSAYWTVAEGGIPTWKTLPVEEVPAE